MYKQTAEYYDKIYQSKDYKTESGKVHSLIEKYKRSPGNEMLDVACGTGNHIQYLKKQYDITGIDLDKDMLDIARKKSPEVKFLTGDMRSFKIEKKFDVIVCLFSAIAHLTSKADLRKAINNFSSHLKPGGVLIFDGFIEPGAFKPDFVHAVFVNEPDLKIYRVNVTKRKRNIVLVDFHILIADKKGVEYITENHKLAMYENKDFLDIMKNAGLRSSYLKNGLMKNRGLFVGIKNKTYVI